MKRRKHTPDQGAQLTAADRLLAEGQHVPQAASTWQTVRWRRQFGGLKAGDAKRLKELGNENTRLNLIFADKLKIDAVRGSQG